VLKEYRRLVPYFKKHSLFYLFGFIFLVITDAGQLLLPQYMKQGIDAIARGGGELSIIGLLMLKMVFVALIVAASRFGWRFFIHGASMRIERELRDDFFDHLLKLSSSFYQKNKTGDLMARATNDIKSIRMATGMGVVALVDGLFMTLAILIILFSSHPRLSFLVILPLPFLTTLVIRFGPLLGKRFRQVQENYSDLSDKSQEAFSGVRVIKSFVKENYFLSLFDKSNERYQKSTMNLVKIWGFFFPAIAFLSGLTVLILLYFGGRNVMSGKITPGDFVALLSYLDMLIWPMMGAGFMVNMIQRGAASLARLNQVFLEPPEIVSTPGSRKIEDFDILEIEGLNFSYPEKDVKPVLQDIKLILPRGKTLGILGRTGAGKTTLLKILPRLLDPPEGKVFINGFDLRDLDLSALRKLFAQVPQDTFLFSASIRENIVYGKPEVAEDSMMLAAKLSTIDRDVGDFPSGWDTKVGEKGITLSGGQKQRIAISRAILLDAPILIFDDALSAVDTDTEKKILSTFFKRRKGKTNILVSHRISTLEMADFVVVMEKGRITQHGSPTELLEQEGLYREIAVLQSLEAKGVKA